MCIRDRLKTQLDQYTDLSKDNAAKIERVISQDQLQAFRGVYLETAQRLKAQQDKGGSDADPVQQLDFEFLLFASAVIDYDYIMALIARYTQAAPARQRVSREELIGLLSSTANLMNERDDIADYIGTLKMGEGLSEQAIRQGYETFKAEKNARQLAAIADQHGLDTAALQAFVDGIMGRMIFDGERLSDLLAPLGLRCV